MAHGGGGRLMNQLIDKIFVTSFANATLSARHDSAILKLNAKKLAFTTDSYVVHPLFFPGGDIGSLAIYGTVNDLAMSGARPLYISCGFIIEEGLPTETLWKVAQSMKRASELADVTIVTGDTKVVDHGKGDGLFINTSGIGVIEHDMEIAPTSVRLGDAVILSGDIGRHGMAIMSAREGIQFESQLESDCTPLSSAVLKLLKAGIAVHCLRDLTRGGLAAALVEIAEAGGTHINVEESAITVRPDVQGACEVLGLDPIHVANEGRFVAFVPQDDAGRALGLLRQMPECIECATIGRVTGGRAGIVTMKSKIGAMRIIDMLSGEQLPRIC